MLKGMERARALSLHGGPPISESVALLWWATLRPREDPYSLWPRGSGHVGLAARLPHLTLRKAPPSGPAPPRFTSPGSRATILCWETGSGGGAPSPAIPYTPAFSPPWPPSQEVPTSRNPMPFRSSSAPTSPSPSVSPRTEFSVLQSQVLPVHPFLLSQVCCCCSAVSLLSHSLPLL